MRNIVTMVCPDLLVGISQTLSVPNAWYAVQFVQFVAAMIEGHVLDLCLMPSERKLS